MEHDTSTILQAFENKLEEEMLPLDLLVTDTQAMLEAYRKRVRDRRRYSLLGSLLAFLGMAEATFDPEADSTEDARLAANLKSLSDRIAPAVSAEVNPCPKVVSSAAEPTALEALPAPADEPLFEPPASREDPAPTVIDLEVGPPLISNDEMVADPEDVKMTERVLAESRDLANDPDMTDRRFQLKLQVLVAETRLLIDLIPPSHRLAWKLQSNVRYLGHLKQESGNQSFVHGLSKHHKADWLSIATASRRQLDQINAELEAKTGEVPCSNTITAANASDPQEPWPSLPNLRRAMEQNRPVVMVGGDPVAQKISLVKRRFGVEVDWICSDSLHKVHVLAERIASGKVAAVIVLEKLLGHKEFNPVRAACTSSKTPMAYGERGGVANLAKALGDIETMLLGPAASCN